VIPIFSAKAVNAGFDFTAAIGRVLDRHHYILGEEVKAFEAEFAAYTGARECVTLANGTDALELALRAVGVCAGDRVACVANAGFYGSTAIHAIGATPVYVDIEPRTLTMSPDGFSAVLGQELKAVIVTHLYGQMADIEALASAARAAGVAVIEDCAQSHGAQRGGRRAGSFGDVGCFSFYPTKNLGALGDGGAITCNDPAIAARVRSLRQYGWSSKYHVTHSHGTNSRLDEMQAAVLRAKLPLLDASNAERRRIARQYNEAFANLPPTLPCSLGEDYVAHLYVVRLETRDEFRAHMAAQGVGTDIHYPVADHQQQAYAGHEHVRLQHTEQACRTAVTLPCFPGMTPAEVTGVIAAARAYFDKS
jgi:aminotransferase EvaB